MECVRFAVIGTSSISESFVDALSSSDEAVYVGSMSRDTERAERVRARLGGTRAFTTVVEVATCDEVDAVYIASPNALHFEQALACIRAGKHVLVEKPMCANAAQARTLFDAGRACGVAVMEAMRSVHDPAYEVLRAALPRIGRVRRASFRFGKYSSRYGEVLAGRQTNIFDARMATGALMDIGVYCVEACVALFGEPESIACEAVRIAGADCEATGGVIDGAGTILARYPDMLAELAYSKITTDMLPCQIEGELGTITYGGVSVPLEGTLTVRGQACGGASRPGEFTVGDVHEALPFAPCDNNMCYELQDFVACIQGRRAVDEFERITLAALDIMDEARRQAGIVFSAEIR